jgi:hypothetical protein
MVLGWSLKVISGAVDVPDGADAVVLGMGDVDVVGAGDCPGSLDGPFFELVKV